jgi:hypothetical protein
MWSTRSHFEGVFDALPVRPDRRAHLRSQAHRLAYVQMDEENGGVALNISEGGLAVTAAEALTSDHYPTIRIQLPRSDLWIETRGQIAWVSDSKKEAGIHFIDLSDANRQKIREWIKSKPATDEIRGANEHIYEKNHTSKLPIRDRKLEVLSEADEAKFAEMFPSEKSLSNTHSRVTPAGSKFTEQNSGNILQFSKQSPERGEVIEASEIVEPAVLSGLDTASAFSSAIDAVEPADLPPVHFQEENSVLASSVDEPREAEYQHERTQAENTKSDLTRHPPAACESPQPADFAKENSPGAWEANQSSEIQGRAAELHDQEPSAYVSPQATDLIQQLELHRRNQAARVLLEQTTEASAQHRSGWSILVLIFLSAMACFGIGLGVGNGFFNRLLGHDQQWEPRSGASVASSPTAIPAEKDSAGSNAVAENGQKSKETLSSAATDRASGDSAIASEDNSPAEASDQSGAAAASPTPEVAEPGSSDSSENPVPADAATSRVTNKPSATAGTSAHQDPDAPLKSTTKVLESDASVVSAPITSSTPNVAPTSASPMAILVTAPEEKSGPFRLTLAEQPVSASRTLAISAQRSVLIPTQPGPAAAHRPQRLQAGVLIYHIDPQVPASRDQRGMAGTVKVRATIGKGGDVIEVKPIDGPTPLISEVVQAVREWRYTVTLLDGQPLGAEEDVVVEFRPRS